MSYMTVTLQTHESHMTVTLQTHESHMTVITLQCCNLVAMVIPLRFVDAEKYMLTVAKAMLAAQDEIFITDWM